MFKRSISTNNIASNCHTDLYSGNNIMKTTKQKRSNERLLNRKSEPEAS